MQRLDNSSTTKPLFFFNHLVIAHNQQILQGGLNENFRSNSLRVSKLRLAGKTTKISCSSSAGKFINYKIHIYIYSLLSTLERTNENVPSECWEFLIGDSVHLYLGIENKFYRIHKVGQFVKKTQYVSESLGDSTQIQDIPRKSKWFSFEWTNKNTLGMTCFSSLAPGASIQNQDTGIFRV